MCLIETTCNACVAGKHEDCDGWGLMYGPGECKGFPTLAPCNCAGASERYRTYLDVGTRALPIHPNARLKLFVDAVLD